MGVVGLRIVEPAHGQRFVGPTTPRLVGQVTTTGHRPLTFRWYSSLVGPPTDTDTDTSIRLAAGPNPLDARPHTLLPPGTHAITLAAQDRPTTAEADLRLVTDAGMAGGAPVPGASTEAPPPCLIHVLHAEITGPMAVPGAGRMLRRASVEHKALGPSSWASEGYQAINRVRFVWLLDPTGDPPGRRSTSAAVPLTATTVGPDLCFTTAFPTIDTGAYRLTLRVESLDDSTLRHEQSIPVSVIS